jgi:hypothetical protein
MPFDDGLATLRLTGAELADVVARNLGRSSGILSLSGLRAVARCARGRLQVDLFRPDGTPVPRDAVLLVITNDYLASGGDGLFASAAVEREGSPAVRDVLAAALAARGGTITVDDPALFDPARPRLAYPGPRPVACGQR